MRADRREQANLHKEAVTTRFAQQEKLEGFEHARHQGLTNARVERPVKRTERTGL